MKKILFTLLAAAASFTMNAQTDQMTVTLNDGTMKTYNVADIASVTFGSKTEAQVLASTKVTVQDLIAGTEVGCDLVYYDDYTYCLKSFQGNDGYDLHFSVNEDGTMKIEDANDTYAPPYSTVVVDDNGSVEYLYGNTADYSSFDGDIYQGSLWIYGYDTTKTNWNYIWVEWNTWDVVYENASYRTYTTQWNTIAKGNVYKSQIDGTYKFTNFLNSGLEVLCTVDKSIAVESSYDDGTMCYYLNFENNDFVYTMDNPYGEVSQIEYWFYNSEDQSYNNWQFDDETHIDKFYIYGRYGDRPYTNINCYEGTSSKRLSITFCCVWSQNDETDMDYHYVYMDFPGSLE